MSATFEGTYTPTPEDWPLQVEEILAMAPTLTRAQLRARVRQAREAG